MSDRGGVPDDKQHNDNVCTNMEVKHESEDKTNQQGGGDEDDHEKTPGYRMTVEPLVMVVNMITTSTGGVMVDVIQQNLKYSERSGEGFETTVADVNMAMRVVQGIGPLILSMFLGPWSDANGRKPLLILSQCGYLCYSLMWSGLSQGPPSSVPWFLFLVPSILLSATGGNMCFVLTYSCYISDITHPKQRTFRFGMVLGSSLLGNVVGSCTVILAEILFSSKRHVYLLVFGTSSVSCLLVTLYTVFVLRETVQKKETTGRLFSVKQVRSVFRVLLDKSPRHLGIALITIFIVFIDMTIRKGEKTVQYLILEREYSWTLSQYYSYNLSTIVLAGLATTLGSWLLREYLMWTNLSIVLLGGLVFTSGGLLKASSKSPTHFWISGGYSTLGYVLCSAAQSEISTLASQQDTGKMFALSSLMDSLVPLFSAVAYTEAFKLLITSHGGLYVFLVTSALGFLTALLSLVLLLLKKSEKGLLCLPKT